MKAATPVDEFSSSHAQDSSVRPFPSTRKANAHPLMCRTTFPRTCRSPTSCVWDAERFGAKLIHVLPFCSVICRSGVGAPTATTSTEPTRRSRRERLTSTPALRLSRSSLRSVLPARPSSSQSLTLFCRLNKGTESSWAHYFTLLPPPHHSYFPQPPPTSPFGPDLRAIKFRLPLLPSSLLFSFSALVGRGKISPSRSGSCFAERGPSLLSQ